jgi:predicted dehydrogenase
VKESNCVLQIGSQRRSGGSYHTAADFLKSGKFGPIVAAEMTWNVNQPGRWCRNAAVAQLKEQDTDWKRFLGNRPNDKWDLASIRKKPRSSVRISLADFGL